MKKQLPGTRAWETITWNVGTQHPGTLRNILHSQMHGVPAQERRCNPRFKTMMSPDDRPRFKEVTRAKEFRDAPYLVLQDLETQMFIVVFERVNDEKNWLTFTVPPYYRGDKEYVVPDSDTKFMYDVLSDHSTKHAAVTRMRDLAARARAATVPPAAENSGEECNFVDSSGQPICIDDLLSYRSCPGIIWRVVGERRVTGSWVLGVEPVWSFLVDDGTNKPKELSARDVAQYVTKMTPKQIAEILRSAPTSF